MFHWQSIQDHELIKDILVKTWTLKLWNNISIWKDTHMKAVVQHEWRLTLKSQRIYEQKSQVKIHKIIKIISKIFNSIYVKTEWQETVMCQL